MILYRIKSCLISNNLAYEEAEKDAQSYSQCPENKRKGKPCLFKKSDLGECADFEFGNANNDMCIYIKLGNVYEAIN